MANGIEIQLSLFSVQSFSYGCCFRIGRMASFRIDEDMEYYIQRRIAILHTTTTVDGRMAVSKTMQLFFMFL